MACEGLTSSSTRPFAVEFVNPPTSVNVNDTVTLHAVAVNRAGDSIPGSPLVLVSLDPDTMAVLDTTALKVTGVKAGTGRLVVKAGDLPSAPLLITIK